jgi:hypothetical protein
MFAFSFLFASRPLSDGDFWWHLKTGQYIVQNHVIPTVDFYSFTNFGKPWVAHEWLSEVIFFLIYSRFGFNALIVIFAILTALAFWLVFKRSHAHPFIAGFATLLGAASVLTNIGVRPRVFTLLFASTYLFLLQRYQKDPKSRLIWWTVPIMAVWVNLHAGYLIGLVLIVFSVFGIILDELSDGEKLSNAWNKVNRLGLVAIFVLLVVNLNPQGPRILLFPFEFFFSSIQQNTVNDWLSPNFHEPEMIPLALLIVFTVGAIALTPQRIKKSELVLFLATMYATLKSNRHVAIFALVAAPLLSDYLQHFLESTNLRHSFKREGAERRVKPAIVVMLLLPLVLLGFRLRSQILVPPRQDRVGVPLKAVDYLRENQLTGNTFTDPNIWSGYLIWAAPMNPVYIDGRIDMYGDQFVKEYLDVTSGIADWRTESNRYQIRNAIISTRSLLRIQLQSSPEWKLVYQDEMALLFIRR